MPLSGDVDVDARMDLGEVGAPSVPLSRSPNEEERQDDNTDTDESRERDGDFEESLARLLVPARAEETLRRTGTRLHLEVAVVLEVKTRRPPTWEEDGWWPESEDTAEEAEAEPRCETPLPTGNEACNGNAGKVSAEEEVATLLLVAAF